MEEVVQRDTGVLAYLYQVLMRPRLQAHERHSDIQGPEELKKSRDSGEGLSRSGGHKDALQPDTHCVQEEGHFQGTVQQVLEVWVPLDLRVKREVPVTGGRAGEGGRGQGR